MMPYIDARWPVLAVVIVLALLIAWWLYSRATRVAVRRERRPDVLDEGAAPARRNQALIDAPPASAAITVAPAAEAVGGVAEVIAAAAQEEAAAVAALKEAEAQQPATAWQPVQPSQSAPAVQPSAEAPAGADDLTRIKGVGPKLAALLAGLGVTSYAQIAAWGDADLDRIDGQIGTFAGRPRRDRWVDQARLLAAGDTAGYEGAFGKL